MTRKNDKWVACGPRHEWFAPNHDFDEMGGWEGRTVIPKARRTPNSHAFSVILAVKETNNIKKQRVITAAATKNTKLEHSHNK